MLGEPRVRADYPARPREAFASPIFSAARAWAEREGVQWCALSFAHGVLLPTTMISPTPLRLDDAPLAERRRWGAQMAGEIRMHWPDAEILYVGPRAMADALAGTLDFERPVDGFNAADAVAHFAADGEAE